MGEAETTMKLPRPNLHSEAPTVVLKTPEHPQKSSWAEMMTTLVPTVADNNPTVIINRLTTLVPRVTHEEDTSSSSDANAQEAQAELLVAGLTGYARGLTKPIELSTYQARHRKEPVPTFLESIDEIGAHLARLQRDEREASAVLHVLAKESSLIPPIRKAVMTAKTADEFGRRLVHLTRQRQQKK